MKTILTLPFGSLKDRLLLVAALASVGLSITLPTPALAQIYTGDLDLPTQDAVNAFHYTEVTGNLTIGNSVSPEEVKDLSPLSTLTRVGGNLILHGNEVLSNIDGLEALRSVG